MEQEEWVIQVFISAKGSGAWWSVHSQYSQKPYIFSCKAHAVDIMEMCYPNLVVDKEVRVIQVDERMHKQIERLK